MKNLPKYKLSRRKFLIGTGAVLALSAIGGGLFVHTEKFGAKATGMRKERILNSPHYQNGEFKNFEPLMPTAKDGNFLSNMKELVYPTKGVTAPIKAIPAIKTDLKNLSEENKDVFVWLGHSSSFLQIDKKKILIDPVFSSYASPLPFLIRAFDGTRIYACEDMPAIDILVISHDHWDHLDYATVMGLKNKIKHIVCPLGVGSHLESWGFAPEIIHEGDWYEEIAFEDSFKIHVLPSRHFSGRLFERNQTLWGSFAFVSKNKKIFYSGDGGYGKHFKEIGKLFGGFDFAIMEDGQYNESWHSVHMMPEESAAASCDINAKIIVPVHSGKFCLSPHRWQEPYERLKMASQNANYKLITPKIGQSVYIDENLIQNTNYIAKNFADWWTI